MVLLRALCGGWHRADVPGWSDERPQIILSAHESPPVAQLPGEESWPLQHVAPKLVNGYVPANDMPLGMALSGA